MRSHFAVPTVRHTVAGLAATTALAATAVWGTAYAGSDAGSPARPTAAVAAATGDNSPEFPPGRHQQAARQEALRMAAAATARPAGPARPARPAATVRRAAPSTAGTVRRAAPRPAARPLPAKRASRSLSRTSLAPRDIAKALLAERGWSSQYSCLDSLWTKESNWRVTADNPTSSAYGIPQALPGSKMSSAGADWRTNPATQITWGLRYIDSRYGTPCAAWSHSRAHNWY